MGCISLVAVFFVAVIAFGLAYQTRPVYKIDLGERLDRPFATNFFEREPPEKDRSVANYDGTSYRWTRNESFINLPGIGSQPLNVTLRYNPVINPNPKLAILVNDKAVALPPAQPDWNEVTFKVPADWFRDGHLHIRLKAATFRPPADPRDLGVLVDWLKIEPAETGQTTFIRPPDNDFVPLVITAVLAVLVSLSIGVPILWALGFGCLVVAGFSYWLINDRLSLTSLMEHDFIRTLFFLWVVAYIAAVYSPRLFRWLGVGATRRDGTWLAALAVLQFILLYYFQLHPQFLASDTGLNIHRLEYVQQGRLVFTEPLPDNQLAPYPPALYIFLLPWTNLTGHSEPALGNLIEVVNSILAASGVFMVFFLARLVHRPPAKNINLELAWQPRTHWVAVIAAAFYAINKYQFLIFSQGNHANLFGAWAFLLFLCVLARTVSIVREGPASLAGLDLPATNEPMPGSNLNPGTEPVEVDRLVEDDPEEQDPLYDLELLEMERRAKSNVSQQVYRQTVRMLQQKYWPPVESFIRYLLPMAALLLVFLAHYGTFLFANVFVLTFIAARLVMGSRRRQTIYLAFCWLTALALAMLLYYHNNFYLISDQFGRMLGATVAPGATPRPAFDLGKGLTAVYTKSRNYFGLMVLLSAAGGLALWLLGRWKRHLNTTLPGGEWWRPGPIGTVLAALGLTSLLFALAEEMQGLETRYQLYGITALVIVAALFLGRIWRSGPGGIVLVGALFLFQLLDSLIFWLDRVTYYFLG